MGRLQDRIAIITAAGSGMGRAAAERFAADGAHVVVSDLSAEAATNVADHIVANGGSAEPLALDVADPAAVRAAVDAVGAARGRVHILFNHAGSSCTGTSTIG